MNIRNESALIKAAIVIAIIGALNWGLIGFFNFNLVDGVLGGGAREQTSALARLVYAIVGLAGLVSVVTLRRLRPAERAAGGLPGRKTHVSP